MGVSQRNKGKRGELELAHLLEENLGVSVTRNLMQTREGGYDLNGLPVALEVKRQERVTLPQWWQQVCEQGGRAGKLPVLAWRGNRQPWRFRVMLRFIDGETPPVYCYTADLDLDAFCYILREKYLKK